MSSSLAGAYEGVADAWDTGPARAYARLAEAIVDAYPAPLVGQTVLDLGAGTGVLSRVLRAQRARTIGVDIAADMVAHMRAHGLDAEIGDLLTLPFGEDSFDGAVAAFSLSHVDDPVQALAEAGRVVLPGGVIMAAVFADEPRNTSKDVVDSVAESFGFVRPDWHVQLKTHVEPLTNTPSKLQACAHAASLVNITVAECRVETGVSSPEDIVASRLGMAHLARFVDTLPAARRVELEAAAVAVVARDPQPLRPVVLIMSSRVRA